MKKYILKNLSTFFPKQKILVISDLHIGIEESYSSIGQMIPKFQFKEIEKQLTKLIKETKPDKVIICGDLKHEFGTISDTEWRETLKVIDLIAKYAKVILVRGNHDTILGPIANKRNIEIANYYIEDDLLFIHGDKLPEEVISSTEKTPTSKMRSITRNRAGGASDLHVSRSLACSRQVTSVGGAFQEERVDNARRVYESALSSRGRVITSQNSRGNFASILKPIKTIIIGHEHPAITLEHEGRKEKYKCFLVGTWKGKELLVLPSFNQLTEGFDVFNDKVISPLLTDISKFEVFIVGDEVLYFGTVKDIKKKFG